MVGRGAELKRVAQHKAREDETSTMKAKELKKDKSDNDDIHNNGSANAKRSDSQTDANEKDEHGHSVQDSKLANKSTHINSNDTNGGNAYDGDSVRTDENLHEGQSKGVENMSNSKCDKSEGDEKIEENNNRDIEMKDVEKFNEDKEKEEKTMNKEIAEKPPGNASLDMPTLNVSMTTNVEDANMMAVPGDPNLKVDISRLEKSDEMETEFSPNTALLQKNVEEASTIKDPPSPMDVDGITQSGNAESMQHKSVKDIESNDKAVKAVDDFVVLQAGNSASEENQYTKGTSNATGNGLPVLTISNKETDSKDGQIGNNTNDAEKISERKVVASNSVANNVVDCRSNTDKVNNIECEKEMKIKSFKLLKYENGKKWTPTVESLSNCKIKSSVGLVKSSLGKEAGLSKQSGSKEDAKKFDQKDRVPEQNAKPSQTAKERDTIPRFDSYPFPEYACCLHETVLFQKLKAKRRKLSCPDKRFFPGKYLMDLMEEELKSFEVSFCLNLYCEGFSIDLFSPVANASGPSYPYDRTMYPLLRAINGGWLPGSILSSLPCKYKDGCILVEVRDYRHTSNRASSVAKSSQPPSPSVYRVLLRSSTESRIADIEEASNGEWTDDLRLSVESLLLQASKPTVCLDPDPKVAEAAASIHFRRNCMNVGAPLRRVVALPPIQSFNLKLSTSGSGLNVSSTDQSNKSQGTSRGEQVPLSNSQQPGIPTSNNLVQTKAKGKSRTKESNSQAPSREVQATTSPQEYRQGGLVQDAKIRRFSPESIEKILMLKKAVNDSKIIPKVPKPLSVPSTMHHSTPPEIAGSDEKFRDCNNYRELRVVVWRDQPLELLRKDTGSSMISKVGVSNLEPDPNANGDAVTCPCRISFLGWLAEGDSTVSWSKVDENSSRGALRIDLLGDQQEKPCWNKSKYMGSEKDTLSGLRQMDYDLIHSDDCLRIPLIPSHDKMMKLGQEYLKQLAREGHSKVEANMYYPTPTEEVNVNQANASFDSTNNKQQKNQQTQQQTQQQQIQLQARHMQVHGGMVGSRNMQIATQGQVAHAQPMIQSSAHMVQAGLSNDQSLLQQSPLQQSPLQQSPLQQSPLQQSPLQQSPLQQSPLQQSPLHQGVIGNKTTSHLSPNVGQHVYPNMSSLSAQRSFR